MSEPQRREQRRTHLDASVVPVERAFLERARVLSQDVLDAPETPEATDDQAMMQGVMQVARAVVSAELLAMAEELHWH